MKSFFVFVFVFVLAPASQFAIARAPIQICGETNVKKSKQKCRPGLDPGLDAP
jgi:multisubunit Na+/H+ antiporter MnhG subunit